MPMCYKKVDLISVLSVVIAVIETAVLREVLVCSAGQLHTIVVNC